MMNANRRSIMNLSLWLSANLHSLADFAYSNPPGIFPDGVSVIKIAFPIAPNVEFSLFEIAPYTPSLMMLRMTTVAIPVTERMAHGTKSLYFSLSYGLIQVVEGHGGLATYLDVCIGQHDNKWLYGGPITDHGQIFRAFMRTDEF